jgi:hypothetical protein
MPDYLIFIAAGPVIDSTYVFDNLLIKKLLIGFLGLKTYYGVFERRFCRD